MVQGKPRKKSKGGASPPLLKSTATPQVKEAHEGQASPPITGTTSLQLGGIRRELDLSIPQEDRSVLEVPSSMMEWARGERRRQCLHVV